MASGVERIGGVTSGIPNGKRRLHSCFNHGSMASARPQALDVQRAQPGGGRWHYWSTRAIDTMCAILSGRGDGFAKLDRPIWVRDVCGKRLA